MGLFDIFKKKSPETPQPYQQEIVPNKPELQFVSLFFEDKPILDKEKILSELKLRFNEVNTAEGGETPLAFFFPEYMINLKDSSIPAQGAILEMDAKVNLDRYTKAFQQSWHWSDAESVMQKCNFEINLVDLMSRTLPHQARLDFFQKFVISVVKATNPSAIYFRNSDKLLDPTDFLEACDSENSAFLHGAMNVRMFNISNGGKNELLMDTLGLHAFGIADFECRFSNYDPSEVAGALQNVAYYVFDTGDNIRSNSTIQGVGKNPIWRTRYSDSKVEPTRLIVEVIPD